MYWRFDIIFIKNIFLISNTLLCNFNHKILNNWFRHSHNISILSIFKFHIIFSFVYLIKNYHIISLSLL